MSDEAVAALHSCLPAGIRYPVAGGEWKAAEIAEFQQARLSEAGYRVVRDQPDHHLNLDAYGWTLEHSIACREAGEITYCDWLEAVRRADNAEPQWLDAISLRGRWKAELDEHGSLVIGERVNP